MIFSPAVLKALENEPIEIFRETAAAFRKPVMSYLKGGDSPVLLHSARKTFPRGPIPFPLVHLDTTWKFKKMISFRNKTAKEVGFELLVQSNHQGIADGITPFSVGASESTRIMKTVALRDGLDKHGFYVTIEGSRRDEKRSWAKECILSVRLPGHRWDPRTPRPELLITPNPKLATDQTILMFSISDWTELDVFTYIPLEDIKVSPLYFAEQKPIVRRGNQMITVDDERYPWKAGKKPEMRKIRFRKLKCYPVTEVVDSDASTMEEVVHKVTELELSERATRRTDGDKEDSMEKKKTQGYF